ncbi:unnamed protein product [Symbiodinium natans]|uniref:Uncharacterized protein n=1 Tax=Symbiodinium natans TaxID=878477 RepID=A0A812QY32_9DINO|nr:unnamed protein product [Symbiodinium natans]
MEAAHNLACHPEVLANRTVSRELVALSARCLVTSLSGRLAARVGRRCVDAWDGMFAAAMKVSSVALPERRSLCRRRLCLRECGWPQNAERADWFVACVPLSCLGHDADLRNLLWSVYGLRFAERADRSQASAQPQADVDLRIVRLFGFRAPAPYPLERLDPDLLEDAGRQGPYDLVTVTDSPKRAYALTSSVQWPVRLRVLQPPAAQRPWKFKYFDAERYMLSYVTHLRKRGHGGRLVVFVDAFDVAAFPCHRNLSKVLHQLGRPVAVGMEFDLFPAGDPGYPLPAEGSYATARENLAKVRGAPVPLCRYPRPIPFMWDRRPPEEHEPCVAVSESVRAEAAVSVGEFLNCGVYAGSAGALERVLRHLLHVHARLGPQFRAVPKTQQYLWNQFFLDHPQKVALDYGAALVVNMISGSPFPKNFGVDPVSGRLKSVIFQKPVCFLHANGHTADPTFHLLRAAEHLQVDTTRWAGYEFPGSLNTVAAAGLRADKLMGDRIVVDANLCFPPFERVPGWRGSLTAMFFVTPYERAAFQDLQFFIARPQRLREIPSGEFEMSFEIVHKQMNALQTAKNVGRAKLPNGTHVFAARKMFRADAFNMHLESGDCLGWRCKRRCDFTYAALEDADELWQRKGPNLERPTMGVWFGHGHELLVGAQIALATWLPISYAIGVQAQMHGYAPIP